MVVEAIDPRLRRVSISTRMAQLSRSNYKQKSKQASALIVDLVLWICRCTGAKMLGRAPNCAFLTQIHEYTPEARTTAACLRTVAPKVSTRPPLVSTLLCHNDNITSYAGPLGLKALLFLCGWHRFLLNTSLPINRGLSMVNLL